MSGTKLKNYPTFHTVWIVKDYVRSKKRGSREMFVPLSHPPGHAQADFGEALVVIGGVERKAYFLAFDLPHSDACYIRAYPAANTEAWLDGHVHAFAFFGGVPWSILYNDAMTSAWSPGSCRMAPATAPNASARCCLTM